MSELDKHFGPKPAVAMPPAKQSHFGRYPVRIRSVADAFIDEMGWNTDPTTIRDVAAGAKRFVDVHGERPELVRKTIRHIRHRLPHIYKKIGDPGSLYKIARGLDGSEPTVDTSKYELPEDYDE